MISSIRDVLSFKMNVGLMELSSSQLIYMDLGAQEKERSGPET